MNLSEPHRQIIIAAAKQVPPVWQTRFIDSVVDSLFVEPDLSDEDVRRTCKQIGMKMEFIIAI